MKIYFTFLLTLLLHTVANGKTYDILAYGAEADGKTINTKAIQKAIDACTPGDTVYIQTGRYLTGTVHLKSNITLYISKEGFLIGSSNINDYEVLTNQSNKHYGMLAGDNITNVNITGPGTMEGALADFARISPVIRPQYMMLFTGCKAVIVQNLQVLNIPYNGIEFAGCHDCKALTLKVKASPEAPEARGLHFDNCINSRVSGCDIFAENNAIAVSGNSKAAVINNCTLQSFGAAISILSADSGVVSNISVSHVNINHSGRGISLVVNGSGGIEDINCADVYIESVQHLRNSLLYGEPVYVWANHNADSIKSGGTIKNIRFNNILCNAENQLILSGTNKSPLQNVQFDNLVLNIRNSVLTSVTITPRSAAFMVKYIAGLSISNIALNWQINQGQQYFDNGISVNNFKELKLNHYLVSAAPAIPNTHAVVLTDGSQASIDAGDVLKIRVTEPLPLKPAPKSKAKKFAATKNIARL